MPAQIRRALLVEEFFKDFCMTAALRRTGFKGPSAKKVAKQIFDEPAVKELVARRTEERLAALKVNGDRVFQELARVAFSNIADLMDDAGQLKPLNQISREHLASVQSVEVSVDWAKNILDDGAEVEKVSTLVSKAKLWDKGAALALFCKLLGLEAPSKHEHEVSGPGKGPIQVQDGRKKLTTVLDDLARKLAVDGAAAGATPEGRAGLVDQESPTE